MKTNSLQRESLNSLMRSLVLAVLIFYTWFLCGTVFAQVDMPAGMEDEVLAENWKRIIELVPEPATNAAPACRIIKGNACLALNRNNESFGLFLSASSSDELGEYAKWASSFSARYPDRAISHYFKGDALARQTNWTAASSAFSEALKIQPRHVLALNARGVVHARQNKIGPATKDFAAAIKESAQTLADAHANDGYLLVQRKEGAKGAKEAFSKAIRQSPDFALALHGRGCVELIIGENDLAGMDLKQADSNGAPFVVVLVANEARFAGYRAGYGPQRLLADFEDPAMTLRMSETKEQTIGRAAQAFEIGQKLEGMSYLPFNQHFSRFYDTMGRQKLGDLYTSSGNSGLAEFKAQHPDMAARASASALRFKQEDASGKYEGIITMGRELSQMFSASAGVSIGQTKGIVKPEVKIGVDVGRPISTAMNLAADHDTAMVARERLSTDAILKQYGPPKSASSAGAPGGVLARVRVQDGNWPIVPLYGLAYGCSE